MTSPSSSLLHADLTRSVIGAFYEAYNHLGPWHPEHICSRALELELRDRGHALAREYPVEVLYKGRPIGVEKLDLVVEERVICEIKAGEHLRPGALLQLYSYLKATRLEVGLLFFFGPKPAFKRAIFTNDRMQLAEQSVYR